MNDYALVESKRIDPQKWDLCIANSSCANPLAFKWALDALCKEWVGFVLGDYQVVVPLPTEVKFYGNTLQMPPDVQYYGVFSDSQTNPAHILQRLFISPFFSSFRLVSLPLPVVAVDLPVNCECRNRSTYHLPLNADYPDLYNCYSRRHKRNLRFFYESGYTVSCSDSPDALLDIRKQLGKSNPNLFMSADQLTRCRGFINVALHKGNARIYYAYDESGVVQGGGLFIVGLKRIVFFMISSTSKGLMHRSGFAIVDMFIREHHGYDGYIDFFGSDMPSIAEFNRGFGARQMSYSCYSINNMGFCVRWIKRMRFLKYLKSWLS